MSACAKYVEFAKFMGLMGGVRLVDGKVDATICGLAIGWTVFQFWSSNS